MARHIQFREDILAACGKIPGGSNQYRAYIESSARVIVADLRIVGGLPIRFKNLQASSIVKLVHHWQGEQLTPKTIKNRLAVLRQLTLTQQRPISLPSNALLAIKTNKQKIKKHSAATIMHPEEIDCPPVRPALLLQYHFGLKKLEALRFTRFMIQESRLEVPRSISYNKTDRRIPIISDEQKALALQLKQNTPHGSPKMIRALSLMHSAALKTYHIGHAEHFRHLYIFNRMTSLLARMSEAEAFKLVSAEVGYFHVTQVKEIFACLKNS